MFLNISFSLLAGVFLIFLLSSLGFIFNLSISPLYIITGLLTTFAIFSVRLYFEKTSFKRILFYCMLLAAALVAAVYLSAYLMDASYDGRAYHQVSVLLLNKGWNPIYDNITSFCTKHFGFAPYELLWCENYVKFSEIFAANILTFTNKIETGKVFNIISAATAFFYIYYVFSKESFLNICSSAKNKLSARTKTVFAFLLIYNPVVVAQFFTYYIDGLLYLYFLIAAFSVIDYITGNLNNKGRITPLLIFIMSSVILVNIKLGGVFCFICILLGTAVFLLSGKIKPDSKIKTFKIKPFSYSVFIIFLLALLTGVNPYFTNIAKGRHALHPLTGKEKIDIITPNSPKAFRNKPSYYKFFASVFSKTDNFHTVRNKNPEFKIPFTVYKSEISPVKDVDTRVAGFGVFFSGIFLFGLILFFTSFYKKCILCKKYRSENSLTSNEALFLLFLIFGLSVILNSENWWARYVPQLWALLIFTALFTYSAYFENIYFKKAVIGLFLAIMFTNTLFINILNLEWSKRYTKRTKENIYKIKALSTLQGGEANLQKLPETKPMNISFLRKLDEAGIKYKSRTN